MGRIAARLLSWSETLAKRKRSVTAGTSRGARPSTAATSRVAGTTRPRAATRPAKRLLSGPLLLAGLLAAAVVGVMGLALLGGSGASRNTCAELLQPQQGASAANPIVTPNLGNLHVATGSEIDYPICPPASGPHYNERGVAPRAPGFYTADAGVGPGSWVHNLEHGFVVVLYRCVDGTCPSNDELNEIRSFVLNGPSTPSAVACGYQSKVLAARFDDMATPFALIAWDRVLLLDEFDTAVAQDFAQRWIETTGPEKASC